MNQLRLWGASPASLKLKRQRRLITDCMRSGKSLADALAAIGWTYDDLQYVDNEQIPARGAKYFSLDEFAQKANSIPVVSFFAGAGGLDLGLEAAGFGHAALVEHNELFCETLRVNRSKWVVLGPPDCDGDVAATEKLIDQLKAVVGTSRKGFEGLFVGGPPCQPFSIAANQRFSKSGKNFKRVGFSHEKNGNLLFDFIKLIKYFRPGAFLIENVPGLLDLDSGEQLQLAYRDLESAGYSLHEPTVLIAAEHYVPQSRTRLFIVGNRLGRSFEVPKPTGSQLSCAGAFKTRLTGLPNHVTREHSAQSIARYMELTYGARDQLGRVDRLDPRLPSKTVIAGGTAGGGRSHLHPFFPRTLSVRECAILQTFPNDYVFQGPSARQFTQVGNAVPPVLAAQLGSAIHKSIFG